MVDRWEEQYPSEQALVLAAPQRQDIALSVAHKTFLLIAIVAMIIGLWALTSGPRVSQATDATLGPPMGPAHPVAGPASDAGP